MSERRHFATIAPAFHAGGPSVRAWAMDDGAAFWSCSAAAETAHKLALAPNEKMPALVDPAWHKPQGMLARSGDTSKAKAVKDAQGQSQILCKLQMRHEQSRIIHCARQRIYPTAALCAV